MSELDRAADLLDPPEWQPPDRPPPLPHQRPPEGNWRTWILEAGRDSGKTEACSRYFAGYMRAHPGSRGRIIAPTFGDAVQSCIEGPSGLKSIDPDVRWIPSAPGGAVVRWPNGSEALVLGTPTRRDVERLRATGNRHLDWWEEMAANARLKEAWAQAELGLRLGDFPHAIGSTTPRPRLAYREIRALPETARTHASIDDNPHANPDFVRLMKKRYGGTRLGRQELGGELVEDSDRALVRRQWIEDNRVDEWPEALVRVRAIGLDPGGEGNQALVVMGSGLDGFLYVYRSQRPEGTATDFLRHAVRLADDVGAYLVVEKNHGGTYLLELLQHVMRDVGISVAARDVWASAGKRTRAEPAGILIEQGRVRWVGSHPALEDEWCMTDWDALGEGDESPHLADAMVWACESLSRSPTIGHEHELAAVPFR